MMIVVNPVYLFHVHTGSSPDSSSTLHVVGAYLLNVQDFSFLSSQDTHQSPSTVSIPTTHTPPPGIFQYVYYTCI